MKIISIKGTNVELTESILDTIEKKLFALEKFTQQFEPVVELLVEVGKTTRHHKTGPFWRAEATLHVPHAVLRAEATDIGLYGAIDLLKDELVRQIKGYKEKSKAKMLRGARRAKKLKSFDPDALAPGEADPSKRHWKEG